MRRTGHGCCRPAESLHQLTLEALLLPESCLALRSASTSNRPVSRWAWQGGRARTRNLIPHLRWPDPRARPAPSLISFNCATMATICLSAPCSGCTSPPASSSAPQLPRLGRLHAPQLLAIRPRAQLRAVWRRGTCKAQGGRSTCQAHGNLLACARTLLCACSCVAHRTFPLRSDPTVLRSQRQQRHRAQQPAARRLRERRGVCGEHAAARQA